MLAGCRKIFTLIILLAGCFGASTVLALGLGELRVNSSLNEPLDATIQLFGLDGLTETQILVSMGNSADYELADAIRVALIDDIDYEIIVLNDEEGVLILSSEQQVVEPFLNVVISVRWPNGRLMGNYTALIDLPLFISDEPAVVPVDVPETPAPVREPTPAPVQEAPATQPRILTSDEPEAPQTAAPATPDPEVIAESEPEVIPEEIAEQAPVSEEDTSVEIESGDTLYDIAARNRPNSNVTVEQTMLAIQRSNPDAFIDNNINTIRVGQILRIPSIQEIQSIDQAQALNQIALQNQAADTQPLAFSANNAGADQQGDDELTILSGDAGTDSLSGDSDLAETIAALENQLAISEENLDRARLENAELRARFADLQEQVEILQNIIAMQDERLAQLQANLAENTPEPAAETVQAQEIANTPVQTPAPDNSLMGQLSGLLENTVVLLASLVGLIVLVVGFLVWRRKAAQSEMDDFDLAGAAVAAGPEAFEADEPEGASAGFLTALKNRFSSDDDDDDDDDDVEEDEEDDYEEEGGLLARLKSIFSRSEDDEDDEDSGEEDEAAFAYDEGEEDDEELDDDPEAIEEDFEDDDSEIDDEVSELLDGDFEEDADDDLVNADLDGEDNELIAEDDDDILNLGDFDLDEEDAPITAQDDEVIDEDEAEESIVIAEVEEQDDEEPELAADQGEISASDTLDDLSFETDTVAEDSEEDSPEEVEAFDFSLDEAADTTGDSTEVDSTEEVEVETLDFDAAKAPVLTEPAEEESAETEEVETFDFDVSETPAAEPAAEASTETEEVETFDFDVSDTPAAEPAEAESTEPEEVETYDFDVSSVSSFSEAEGSGGEAEGSDQESESAEEISTDFGELDGDVIEIDVDDSAEDEIDPLAAALDEIDAEVVEDTEESDSDDDGDDFDLGNIEIDDSLFEPDESEEATAPISDRDESLTKLDLAVAYEAMGDLEGAREILNEVIAEGNEGQVTEAKKLLEKWQES